MGFNAALQRQNTRDLEKAKAVENEAKPVTEFKSRAPSFRRELLRRNSREPEPASEPPPVVAAPKE